MFSPQFAPPDLPETMTWEELERLPEETARQIELWEGRVVWMRSAPQEHQNSASLLWSTLRQAARKATREQPGRCWQAATECNVFLGRTGKSDFLTPDFVVFRCLPEPYADIRASDTEIVGEVLSPSNTPALVEAKKARYASAGIPWYWEVSLTPGVAEIAAVRIFALETGHGQLPEGVRPLRPSNYLLVAEATPDHPDGVVTEFPFPVHIPWADLDLGP